MKRSSLGLHRTALAGLALLALAAGPSCGGSSSSGKATEGDSGPQATADLGGDLGGAVADAGDPGACLGCLGTLQGKLLRFASIDVTEPRIVDDSCGNPPCPPNMALPNFLNGIWKEDVRRDILNIMLRPDVVDGGAHTMVVTAGAAWHDVDAASLFALKPYDPVPAALAPTGFHFLDGYTICFAAQVQEDCTFASTTENLRLMFHPGPADHATICTQDYPAQPALNDAIPISHLVATGRITHDCSGIVQGQLEGCIGHEAACHICSYLMAPNYTAWYRTTNEAIGSATCSADYCEHYCGRNGDGSLLWANFGGFIDLIGSVPLSCDSDQDGVDDGYRIVGKFEATIVPALDDHTAGCPAQ